MRGWCYALEASGSFPQCFWKELLLAVIEGGILTYSGDVKWTTNQIVDSRSLVVVVHCCVPMNHYSHGASFTREA